MGRAPCCLKVGLHRGPWTAREDTLLLQYINSHGEGHWSSLPKNAGLLRCGKSCRLRWMNYLRPDIKRGNITPDEEDLILRLHALLGNRWSLIAGRLPGRTDNEIKNYWNTHLRKRLKSPTTKGIETKKQSSTRKRASKSQCVPADEPNKNYQDHISAESADHGGVQEEETTMTRIHIPKVIRVSPFSTRIVPFYRGQGDQKQEQEAACHDSEVSNLHVPRSDEVIKFKYSNDIGEALVCDSVNDFACQNSEIAAATATTMMPLKIYDEYQQLIKAEEHDHLDSFLDSLLI